MIQNDLDNGGLNYVVGVAALHPMEFVLFRIGQRAVMPDACAGRGVYAIQQGRPRNLMLEPCDQ